MKKGFKPNLACRQLMSSWQTASIAPNVTYAVGWTNHQGRKCLLSHGYFAVLKAAATNVRVLSKRVSATSVHFVENRAHGIHGHKVILVNQQPDIFQCYIDMAQDLENRTLVMKARAQARPCTFICVDNGRFDSPQI
jgi:hypothetical protein